MPASPPTWSQRADGSVWISRCRLGPGDAAQLREVTQLTLRNVKMPAGFLAGLRTLRWLDLRGGASADLECLTGCDELQGLVVNQVRGLREVTAVASLTGLGDLVLVRARADTVAA